MLIDQYIYLDGGEFLLASPPWLEHLDYTPLSRTECRLQIREWLSHGRPSTIARLLGALGMERSFDLAGDTKRCFAQLEQRLDGPNANLILCRRNHMLVVLDQSPHQVMVDLVELAGPEPVQSARPREEEPIEHWIEIQLVDARARPIAEQECELSLPDGRTIRSKTDALGLLRVDEIAEPGRCQVSFPALHVTRLTKH